MNKAHKYIIWISLAVLAATILFLYIIPNLKAETVEIDDREVAKAVLEYTNTQMPKNKLKVPAKAEDVQVEIVRILSVKELPGPHQRRSIKCRLEGGYRQPEALGRKEAYYSFWQLNYFTISDKYPSGISVQLND